MTQFHRADSTTRRRFAIRLAVVAGLSSILAICLSAGTRTAAGQSSFAQPNIELGLRIYREGILASGKPIRATVKGDIAIQGSQLVCATCHRRSGFGSSEGASFVPPVTGPSLYQPRELSRANLFRKLFQQNQPESFRARVHSLRERPAYTEESLAIALRKGIDPTGRELDPLMPRYLLGDEDSRNLIAYLRSLSSGRTPGLTDSVIHFATVTTQAVEPEKRKAMLDVMRAYFRWKNADTQRELNRPRHSPFYKDDFYGAYRDWVLHVWELKGPADSWLDQLKRYYREQPVFALLSGMSAGEWRPIHDFCEWAEVPCLFPHTDLPVASQTGAYTLYFSRGLAGEAEVLARYLRDKLGSVEGVQIVQVYRSVESAVIPARALRRALYEYGITRLQDVMIEGAKEITPARWKNLFKEKRPSILVLWLGYADLEALEFEPDPIDAIWKICLSYSLLKEMPPSLPKSLRNKIYLTYPFALPRLETPHIYRVRAWLRSRRVQSTEERIQLNTYFALSVADHSLMNLVENFSRDYFIESIEQETENSLNAGVFPHLSLGPGQRFASKGAYIVKLSDKVKDGIEAVSDWIIP